MSSSLIAVQVFVATGVVVRAASLDRAVTRVTLWKVTAPIAPLAGSL